MRSRGNARSAGPRAVRPLAPREASLHFFSAGVAMSCVRASTLGRLGIEVVGTDSYPKLAQDPSSFRPLETQPPVKVILPTKRRRQPFGPERRRRRASLLG